MKKKKLFIIIIAVFLVLSVSAAVYCLLTGVFTVKKIEPKQTVLLSDITENTDGIRLIAHRGLSATEPENTLPAFEEAGKNGFFGAECDVHRTTDGKWVIMHDGDTKKMCGVRKYIEKSTSETLFSLDITNGANIEKYNNLKIPTVEQYLEVCIQNGVTPVIEIKNADCSVETVRTLYDAVYSVKGVKNVIFISFKKQALESLREIDGEAVCFLLVSDITASDVDYCKENGFGINFNANSKKLKDEPVKYAVTSGIDTACWTVDKKEILNKMLSLGIYTFTTNRILPEE